MYDSWKKWFVKWMAVVLTVVMGMGLCAGFPVGAAYENTHTNTGNQRADIVAIAQTQVGYHEGSLDGTTSGSNNYTKYNVDLYKIDGSYCYAWCQSFIAWCAKQAGVSSSVIKRTAGTIDAMDFFKSQQVWQGNSYTPQSGDIIYFRSSSSNSGYHVGIVESVSGSTIHTIEGNYSNKVARHSVSVGASSIVGYGVPNYEGVTPPDPPKWAKVSLDSNGYMIGELVTFHLSSDCGVIYTVGIDREDSNGERIRIDTYDTKNNYYIRSFDTAGRYSCYITTYTAGGLADSERIYFEIYDKKPEEVKVVLDNTAYMLNENVTFHCSSKYGYAYTIGIDDENGNRIDTYDTKENDYTRSFNKPGKYSCYITTYNGYGLVDSERIYFEIYDKKPEKVRVVLDKTVYMLNENVTFHCSSKYGYAYTIGIDDENGNRIDTYDTKENSYTRVFNEPGKYSCYITTYNGYGLADSERIYFTVSVCGDLNLDRKLTISDTLLLQDYLLGRSVLTNDQKQQADLNQDGVIDGFDLAFLKHLLLASE